MAQLAYGSITITDTNDIESIIIEYARNQSTSTAPTSGWSTTRPAWAQGYYIWQRARIHKSGTEDSEDEFGTAVCITGSPGQTGNTGAAGRSLTSTITKFTHVASGTTQTQVEALAESNWTANVPTYNSSLPDYWVRVTNTYSNPSSTENIYYKDSGLTSANATANEAWNKADNAETNASNALSQATAANQATALLGGHFIYNAEWQTTNTPHSANVVQTILKNGVDVTTDPTKWDYNVHIGANGIRLRNNENILSEWTASALKFNNPSTNNAQLVIGANGTLQSGNYSRGSNSKFASDGTKIDLINGDIITKYFRISQGLEQGLTVGAYIHGTIEALDGKIGTDTTNYWEIGNGTDYNLNDTAKMIGHGSSYIQLGDLSTWRLATNRIHTGWYVTSDSLLHYPQIDSKYWDFGAHVPTTSSDKFIYIRRAKTTSTSLTNLLYDIDDTYATPQWDYLFWVDAEGKVHAPGFYIGDSTTPIGGGAGTVAEKLLNGAGSGTNPVYFRTDTGHVGELTASTSTVGGTTTPIYMNGGTLTALSYTIAKSVPSNAKFTDTVTTVSVTGDGNAITTMSASNGAITATKGSTFLLSSARGAASGVAPLNASSKIDSTYLPSYVDDVLEYNGTSSFPTTGEAGKIYVDTSTNKTYRWGGSTYTEISQGSIVTISRSLTSGTKSATITIDGTSTDIYAPTNTNTTYTFANGTNGFTVTPSGGTAQTVTVTPSITNNVTGTGNSGYLAKWNGAHTLTNGPQLGSDTTTFLRNDGSWAAPVGSTYSAGTGLSLSGSTFNHSNSITAGTAGTSSATSSTNRTISIPYVTYDAQGHITAAGTHTHTLDSFPEAYLAWGGKNFSAGYGPIDAAMIDVLGANRFAFLKAAGLTIEYSTNGGSTWTDYGATDAQKVGLFANGQGFNLGKATAKANNTVNNQLRVTIDTGAASLYTVLNKIAIYMSTNGNTVQVLIEKALQSTPTTYSTHLDWTGISGWSGWNILNISSLTTYGNTASSQYGRVRFTFKQTAINSNYASASISRIMGFGGVGWTVPSNMARDGHLYSYDSSQNATFPAQITATQFNGTFSGSLSGTATGNVTSVQYDSTNTKFTYTKNGSNTDIATIANLKTYLGLKALAYKDSLTKSDVGLDNVTNNAQVKGLSTGTTSGHLVTWGADGYTVADSGIAKSDLVSSVASNTNGQLVLTYADGTSSNPIDVQFVATVASSATYADALTTSGTIITNLGTTGTGAAKTYTSGGDIEPGVKGTLGVGFGGTGKTSWTQWGIVYASASNTLAQVTAGSSSNSGYLLQSGGAAAPSWIQATNSNTASTIVKRDSSGNFSAGTITATLNGSASKLGTANKGSGTKPIYLSGGSPAECSTYAGGTAVTLNGTSKAASTASFYAPTSYGTSAQVLVGRGENTTPEWTDISGLVPSSATNATNDSDGNPINTTYIKKSIGTAAGDIIYWSDASTPVRLAKGSNGQVLKLASGVPSWATDNDSNVKSTAVTAATTNYIVGSTSASTATGGLSKHASAVLYTTADDGTSGYTQLRLGNTTATSSAGGKEGQIRLYGTNATYYLDLKPGAIASSNKTITFPNASGTVALTSDLSNFITDAGVTTITTTAGTHTTLSSATGSVSFKVPTKTSHLTNDSGFVTSSGVTSITPGNGLISGTSGSSQTAITGIGTISMATITRTNNTSTASPAHGGNFTAIDSITTDSYGRVTAINTKTITLPSDNNTDVNVTQTKWTNAATVYDVLLSASATDAATATTTSVKTARLKFDPTNSKLTLGTHANMAYDSTLDALVFSFV